MSERSNHASGRSKFGVVRISAGSHQDLKNCNLLQSGLALGIMTVAGKFSNADANFVEVRSCCFLQISAKQISAPAIVEGTRRTILVCALTLLYSQLLCVRTFRQCSRVVAVQLVEHRPCLYD